MNLPKLTVIKDETRQAVSCEEHDYCSSCELFHRNGGRCEGCTTKHREKLSPEFQWCYQECNTCTGFKADLTAICCRSPLKNMYLDAVTKNAGDWNHPEYNYTDVARLRFKQHAIIYYNYGSARKIAADNDYVCEHEVVAVNMSHCMGMKGNFYSQDMHDFLRVPKSTQIILTTMSIDDHLERAWEKELYGGPERYNAVGIDYWMPLAFSSYAGDARLHKFYQFCKTQLSIERSAPHFYPGYYLSAGFRLDDLHQRALESIPQLIFNTQFFTGSKEKLRGYMSRLKRWHRLAPPGHAFWFVGATSPLFFTNVKKMLPGRELFWVSAKPMYNAVNGKRLKNDGGEVKIPRHLQLDTRDEVHWNYDVFEGMVEAYG